MDSKIISYEDDPSLKPFTKIVDGFQLPSVFPEESFRSAVNYKPRPDDIFIATYPKCGTNWTQQILLLIFNHGEALDPKKLFLATPFLEVTGAEAAEKMPRPGPIKMHLPYHLAPYSDKAKYIYVTRNPKDCLVSYFHHLRGMRFSGTFDELLEYFISGNIDYGDYFDHLLGWYAHRNDPNVLFITYEEMKENPAESILKIASFMDDKLYAEPLRNDPEKLANILKYSSVKHMKGTVNKEMANLINMSKEEVSKSALPDQMKKLIMNFPGDPGERKPIEFVRKGVIGDWKNYFTEEQSKRMDEKLAEKTKGTDIPKLWEKYL